MHFTKIYIKSDVVFQKSKEFLVTNQKNQGIFRKCAFIIQISFCKDYNTFNLHFITKTKTLCKH